MADGFTKVPQMLGEGAFVNFFSIYLFNLYDAHLTNKVTPGILQI